MNAVTFPASRRTDTPDAVSGVKGTYARFLVDPIIGTFVGVDEGAVRVQAKVGGEAVEVEAGQWVLVPPGGLPTRPAPLQRLEESDDPLFRLSDFTTQPPGRLAQQANQARPTTPANSNSP